MASDPHFDKVALLLRCDGDTSTFLADESPRPKSVRVRGAADPIAGAFGGGLELSANSTLTVPETPEVHLYSRADWLAAYAVSQDAVHALSSTCEFWVYLHPSGFPVPTVLASFGNPSLTGGDGYAWRIVGSGTDIALGVSWVDNTTGARTTNDGMRVSSIGSITAGWYHIAVVAEYRNFTGGSLDLKTVFSWDAQPLRINHSSASTESSSWLAIPPNSELTFGGGGLGNSPMKLDDIRFTAGVAREFPPYPFEAHPGAPPPPPPPIPADYDPHYASVALLLHGDGTDGGSTFTDSSPNALAATVVGAVTTDTTTKRFGTASAKVSGASRLKYESSLFDFGAGDFTVEFWHHAAAGSPAGYPVMYSAAALVAASDLAVYCSIDSDGRVSASVSTDQVNATAASTVFATMGAWNHIAFARAGGVLRVFVNGALGGEANAVGTVNKPAGAALHLGNDPLSGRVVPTLHLDEVRITPGVARYTTSFTPLDAPWPEVSAVPPPPPPPPSPQVTGTVVDTSGAPAVRTVRAHRRDTGEVLGEAVSSAVDGSYTIETDYTGEIQLLCMDDDASPLLNDLVARVFAQAPA